MLRCNFCQNNYEECEIDNLFLDYDTSNNSPSNMVRACINCIHAFKLKRAITAILTLRELGFVNKKDGTWVYSNKLVRNEMTNVNELRAENAYLKKQVHDLENYISMLEQKGYELPETHGKITGA